MVKHLPSNASDVRLIPGQGIKISRAAGQISPRAATREKPPCHNEEPTHHNERLPKERLPKERLPKSDEESNSVKCFQDICIACPDFCLDDPNYA